MDKYIDSWVHIFPVHNRLVGVHLLSICAPYKEVVPLLPEEQPVVSGEELLQHLGEWVGEQLVLFPTEKRLKNKIIITLLVANVTKN